MKRRLLASLVPVVLLASCGDKTEDEAAGVEAECKGAGANVELENFENLGLCTGATLRADVAVLVAADACEKMLRFAAERAEDSEARRIIEIIIKTFRQKY